MKNADILLIEPPPTSGLGNLRILGSTGMLKTDMCWPPLDLMIIAGALREIGEEAEIFDAHGLRANPDSIKEIINQVNPKLVVFSTSTSTIQNDLKIASLCKSISKNIITAAFGIHVTALPEEVLNQNNNLDVAIYSEPEVVIPDIVNNNFDISSVKGIYYRMAREIIKNPSAKRCQNRDELGFPAHDKVPLSIYHDPHMKQKPLTMTLAQQGCINSCMYCVCPVFYGKLNSRSIEHVISEMKWIESLGIKELRFFDSGLTSNMKWANKLFDKIIEEDVNLNWVCNVRADKLDIKIARKMKTAGCHTVCIGCESSNNEILKNVGKNIVASDVKKTVDNAKKAGLATQVYFIFGLPGETKKTMEESLKFAKKISPKIVSFNIANPQPGTDFYDYLKEEGYFISEDFDRFDPLNAPVFDYPHLKSKDIYIFMKHAYKSFYLRPGYILKRLINLRSFSELKFLIKNFIGFINRYIGR